MSKEIDISLFDDECLEDEINKALLNTSLNSHSTPRFPCYLKGNILEVWLSGADLLSFNIKDNTIKLKLKTVKALIDTSLINKSYLVKILYKLNSDKEQSTEEILISKFRVLTKKSKLTDKQYEEIEKYERRKKGNWK